MLRKKYLLAGVSIAITVVVSTMTTVAHALIPRTTFMNGLSGGVNVGYQANKVPKNLSLFGTTLSYNAPVTGIHIDYNRIISSNTFLGSGLEANYAFSSGKTLEPGFSLKRTYTAALTLRGGIISGRVAYEINGAFLAAKWQCPKQYFNAPALNRIRPGFAPGVGMTVALDDTKKMSVSAVYRYEIYPKGANAAVYPDGSMAGSNYAVPRLNAHVALIKFNVHF